MEQDFKRSWSDAHLVDDYDKDYNKFIEGRRRTALENLACRYRRFSNMTLVFAVTIPIMVSKYLVDGKVIVTIATIFYFLLCSGIDRWFYYGIKSINCSTMTVAEVSKRAFYYRKRHLQVVIFLLPCEILWTFNFAYHTDFNDYFLYGMALGGFIGLVIGFYQLFKFLADYRRIME